MEAAMLQRGAILVWGVACASIPAHKPRPCLPYEPSAVELSGTLHIITKFGPPNYGENPDSDEKLQVPIITLSDSVDVCGDLSSSINRDAFHGLREIQVLFPEGMAYAGFRDRSVVVTGTLSEAVMSHHFTPVVMVVREIRSIRPGESQS